MKRARTDRKGSVTATCRSRTPRQVSELECFQCEKTKVVESFAREQRRRPDEPKCRDCTEENRHVVVGEDLEDDGNERTDGSEVDGATLQSVMDGSQ